MTWIAFYVSHEFPLASVSAPSPSSPAPARSVVISARIERGREPDVRRTNVRGKEKWGRGEKGKSRERENEEGSGYMYRRIDRRDVREREGERLVTKSFHRSITVRWIDRSHFASSIEAPRSMINVHSRLLFSWWYRQTRRIQLKIDRSTYRFDGCIHMHARAHRAHVIMEY